MFQECAPETSSTIDLPVRFSPGQKYAAYSLNSRQQLIRLDLTSCQKQVVIGTMSAYQTAGDMCINDAGVVLFSGASATQSGVFQINADNTIQPAVPIGQIPAGTVTYADSPNFSRDGSWAAISGVLNNNYVVPLYKVADGTSTILYKTSSQTSYFQTGLYGAEASCIYGYIGSYSSAVWALGCLDLQGVVTNLVEPNPTLNGVQYPLARDGVIGGQLAASNYGVVMAAPEPTTPSAGSITPVDLLLYSKGSNESSVLLRSEDIAPLEVTEDSTLSADPHGRTVVDVRSAAYGSQFRSAIYLLDPGDNAAPQMIAGPGLVPFPEDTNPLLFNPGIGNGQVSFLETDSSGNSIVKFTSSTPYILVGGIGRSTDGAPVVTPGGWFTIYAFSGARCTEQPSYANGFPTSGCVDQSNALPTTVSVNGRAAALSYVSPGQINAQVPWETAIGEATVNVTVGTAQNVGTEPFRSFQ